jgi:hypothetical protein
MPPASPAKTVRQSVLRRRKQKKRESRRSKRSYKGVAAQKTSGVPLAFQEFNRVKKDAEFRGADAFKWNGNTYERHEWTNGVPVWKRV